MSIFISYRRTDGDIVGRIHDALKHSFGIRSVFQDTEDLGAGQFRSQIQRAIEASSVVVAVIGTDWVQERLHDPSDVLRQELELALRKGIPIVPVTLNTTSLPAQDSVPRTLRPVLDFQSYVVRSGAEFGSTVARLIDALRPLLGMPAAASSVDAEPEGRSALDWYKKARSHAGLGERSESLACLMRAIELDPGFGPAHSMRGILLTQEGRRAEAIVAFKSALAINRDDVHSQVLLAGNLAATGDPRQAKWWLEKALKYKLPPAEEGLARSRYAEVLLDLGQFEEAAPQFDQAIRLMGDDTPPDTVGYTYRLKGDALSRAGKFADALSCYEAALGMTGPGLQVLNAKGLALLALDQPEKAKDAFLAGIKMAPDSAGLEFNLACACGRMGDPDAAFAALARAFALDPTLRQAAQTDPDLAPLRKMDAERFAKLVG